MLLRRFSIAFFAFALPLGAIADHHILYECGDPDGAKEFTNVPRDKKKCRVLSVGPLNSAPAAAPPSKPGAKAATSPSPASFPKVDRETQRGRDDQRRRILEQELATEQKMLEQAKKDLAEQESVRLGTERNYQKMLDRLEPYQKKVKHYEDNVANLRKEIGNLR